MIEQRISDLIDFTLKSPKAKQKQRKGQKAPRVVEIENEVQNRGSTASFPDLDVERTITEVSEDNGRSIDSLISHISTYTDTARPKNQKGKKKKTLSKKKILGKRGRNRVSDISQHDEVEKKLNPITKK